MALLMCMHTSSKLGFSRSRLVLSRVAKKMPPLMYTVKFYLDVYINDRSLPRKKILKNLQFVHDFCSTHLPAPGFHLSPKDLVEWGQSGLLNANILALLAHLFDCFEVKELEPSLKKSSSFITQQPCAANVTYSNPYLNPLAHQKISLHSASEGAINKILNDPVAVLRQAPPPPPPPHPLQSHSAGTLLAPPPKSRPAEGNVQGRKSTVSSDSSSFSSSVLAREESGFHTSLHSSSSSSNSRVFQAPLRTSLSIAQSRALATFGKEYYPLTKGAHSRSSPLMRVQVAPTATSANPSSHGNLISVSTDNLNIQNQIKNGRGENRGSIMSQPMRVSHRGVRDTAEPSRFSEGVFPSDTDGKLVTSDSDASTDTPGPIPISSMSSGEILNILPTSRSLELPLPASQVRESFTLSKQHTYASASAAGLPIISDEEKVGGVPLLMKPSVSESSILPAASNPQYTSARSSLEKPKTDSGAIVLTNLLQLHRGELTYTIASQKQPIPPNVKELRVNLRSFITSLQSESVHMEREAMIQRLKLFHPDKMNKDSKTSNENALVSKSAILHRATLNGSQATSTEAAILDLRASASLPLLQQETASGLHKSSAKEHSVLKKTVSSLEQFERDEILIKLQSSPEDIQISPVRHEARDVPTRNSQNSYYPLRKLPLSPIASNGQVFVEETPPLSNQSSSNLPSRIGSGEGLHAKARPNPPLNQVTPHPRVGIEDAKILPSSRVKPLDQVTVHPKEERSKVDVEEGSKPEARPNPWGRPPLDRDPPVS